MGNRRSDRAVPILGLQLDSPEEQTSIAAIRALGRIGTISARISLFFYEKRSSNTRSHGKTIALAQANLDIADSLLADGDKKQVASIYQSVYDKDYPAHIRAVALRGLVAVIGKEAKWFFAEALASDEKQLCGMAAVIVRTVPERKTAETLVADFPELEPNVQVLLINALAARSDGAGATVVKDACNNDDIRVKQVALTALGKIGDETCVPLLIEHGAIESLTKLAGENINTALADRLRDSAGAEKVVICRSLLARDAVEAASVLVDAAKFGDSPVRAEALKALHSLAGREEIPALVDLIFIVEPAEADQVGKALAAVARRNSIRRECTEDILSKYDRAADTEQRVALLLTLGELGHVQALTVLREGLQDRNTQIRYAAIKALSAWPDSAPAGGLLDVARSAGSQTHRVLALRGFIDLVDAAAMPADQKLASYRRAMQAASQDAERKKVLSVLSGLDTLEAFQMAMSHLDDPSLRNEAALAACRIAQKIYTSKGRQLKEDLARIAAADVGDSMKQQALEILRNINKVKFYVTDWEVSGPYVQKGKNYAALFDIVFAPEIDGGNNAKWQKMPAGTDTAQPWFLDLLKALDGGEQRVAYLRTSLEWPAEQRVTLRIGSDDGVKLWINGRLVHANNVARGFTPDQDSATATLKKGENILLMKITQNSMPWGASLRIEHESQ
jgi:HEAT repeat protein